MTTKAKKTIEKKSRNKLALNKETIRDLPAKDKAKQVRGGVCQTAMGTFGTLA